LSVLFLYVVRIHVVRIHQELEGMMHFRKNKQERSESADLSNANDSSVDTTSEVTPSTSAAMPDANTSVPIAPGAATDWEGENSSLSAEEAEEIRAAFQQVLAMEEATDTAPLSMDEALELTIDPLDLRDYEAQVDLIDSFVPENLDANAAATGSLSETAAVVDAPDTEIDRLTEIETLADVETLADAETLAAVEEPICSGFQASAQAVEQIALAVDETDLMAQPTALGDQAETVAPNLTADAAAIVEGEMVTSDWQIDLDEAIAVDAIVEEGTPSLIDSISLVDMGMETEELTSAAPSDAPLTYFQYYLEDESDDADGATYNQTTWRQPSVPAGLIGAGVLGATLISGFMIADSLKQPSSTQAKKPNPPSPLQSLDPQGQTTAMATPKPTAPETMQPEVPLPPAPLAKPDTLAMAPMPTVFPPLPTIAEPPVLTTGSLESAATVITPNPTVAPDLKVGKAVAAPETLPVPPNPQMTPISSGVAVTQPQTESPAVAAMPPVAMAPRTSRGPVFEEVTTAPVGVVPGAVTVNPRVAPPSNVPLPKLEPGVEGTASDLQTVARSTEMPTSDSPVSVTPPTALKETEIPSVFVPVETAPPEITTVSPRPQELEQAAPTELIYRQGVAPTQASQESPLAPTSTTVDPSLQSLLNTSAPGLSATGASLRSLTQAEATAVAQASQLGAFSRQSLGPKEYVQAYQLVSQQLNALPPFGFIDYQRQMILLPADIAASLDQVNGQINQPQMAQADGITLADTSATPF
jgi:hypothetical protein